MIYKSSAAIPWEPYRGIPGSPLLPLQTLQIVPVDLVLGGWRPDIVLLGLYRITQDEARLPVMGESSQCVTYFMGQEDGIGEVGGGGEDSNAGEGRWVAQAELFGSCSR